MFENYGKVDQIYGRYKELFIVNKKASSMMGELGSAVASLAGRPNDEKIIDETRRLASDMIIELDIRGFVKKIS